MKIYRKLIPSIAKEIVRHLLAEGFVEIVDGHREDAELDLASVFVNYLNELDRLNQDARDLLERRGYTLERLGQVKRTMAGVRELAIGDDALDWVLNQQLEMLFNSPNFAEVFAEDQELRVVMRDSIKRYVGVDEVLDKEVRGRLRHLREGTPEWEIEYEKAINNMRYSHGLN